MWVFKSLIGYTDYGGYENRNAHFLIIIKSKLMKGFFLFILNCTLLLNQNDWTVPYLYLGAFCKYVYNQQF
jgi:hypothetical protein